MKKIRGMRLSLKYRPKKVGTFVWFKAFYFIDIILIFIHPRIFLFSHMVRYAHSIWSEKVHNIMIDYTTCYYITIIMFIYHIKNY